MKRWAAVALLAGVAGLNPALAESPFAPLVEGEGAAETFAFCSACHSAMLVAQQGLSRDRWDELLDWMVDEQGMAPLPANLRELVLNYLAENYGEDRPNFPGG